MKRIIAGVLLMSAVVVIAGDELVLRGNVEKHSKVRALKATTEWVNLESQLNQYETHMAQFEALQEVATNKIELVANADTKTALKRIQSEVEKLQQMVDDVHDAVKKMRRVVVDCVELRE